MWAVELQRNDLSAISPEKRRVKVWETRPDPISTAARYSKVSAHIEVSNSDRLIRMEKSRWRKRQYKWPFGTMRSGEETEKETRSTLRMSLTNVVDELSPRRLCRCRLRRSEGSFSNFRRQHPKAKNLENVNCNAAQLRQTPKNAGKQHSKNKIENYGSGVLAAPNTLTVHGFLHCYLFIYLFIHSGVQSLSGRGQSTMNC